MMILKNKSTKFKWLVACLALLLVAAVAVALLLVVFDEEEESVVSFGTAGVTEDAFRFYLASYKYEFLVQYKEEGLEDTGVSWRHVSSDGNRTWEKRFYEEFSDFLARKIAAAALFDASYSLSANSRREISARLDAFVKEYGGKGKLLEDLSLYGCDLDDLRRVMTLDYKAAMLYRVLYGEGGSGLPEGLLEQRYQKEYARVKTVFIRTKAKEGSPALTSEEKEDAERRIATLESYLEDGMKEAEFLSLQKQFNEDESAKSFPNGIYLWEHSVYDEAVIDKALAMKAGDSAIVRGDYGAYLIYRYANPVGAYAQEANAVWFRGFVQSVTQSEYEKHVESVLDSVCFDDDLFYDDLVILTPKNYKVVY